MRGREVKRQQERQTQLPFCMLSLFLSLIALNSMLIGRTIELRPENLPTNDAFARRSLWVARRGIWPTVFIIGSPKAGTTSLAALLFNHSKFCAPRQAAGNKEVSFFNIKQNFQRGTKYYLSFFGKDPKCQRYKEGFHEYVDATPTYLRSAGGGDRMKEAIPAALRGKCRFVVVLREPVSRHLAWFNHLGQATGFAEFRNVQQCTDLRHGASKKQALDCYNQVVNEDLRQSTSSYNLQGGMYVHQLQAWLKKFDRNQTFVVNFEALTGDAKATVAGLGRFLGVDDEEWSKLELGHLNSQPHPSKISLQDLDPRICSSLEEFYEPYNLQLYRLLSHGIQPIGEPKFTPFSKPCHR